MINVKIKKENELCGDTILMNKIKREFVSIVCIHTICKH